MTETTFPRINKLVRKKYVVCLYFPNDPYHLEANIPILSNMDIMMIMIRIECLLSNRGCFIQQQHPFSSINKHCVQNMPKMLLNTENVYRFVKTLMLFSFLVQWSIQCLSSKLTLINPRGLYIIEIICISISHFHILLSKVCTQLKERDDDERWLKIKRPHGFPPGSWKIST